MGTNSMGCTEWERDYDPITERPMTIDHLDTSSPEVHQPEGMTDLQRMFDTIRDILDEADKKVASSSMTTVMPPPPSPKGRRLDRFNITVVHEYPPIPNRSWDWCAYYEGTEESGKYGQGSTPFMAIKDLIANYNPTDFWESLK